jgi:hypothetical protein
VTATGAATGTEPVLLTNNDPKFLFYGPRGVAVDNSFESAYFGTIYVSEGAGGKVTANLGAEDPTRTTAKGIYALSPAFDDLTPEGPYAGNQDWSAANSPYRLAIAPDGKVYLADFSTSAHSGVYIMDPANPTDFTPVFGGTTAATGLATTEGGATIHGRVGHCYILGTGASTQLFTYDWGSANTGDIYRYDIGDLSTTIPWATEPSAIVYNDALNGNLVQGGICSIAPDNRGGWWVCQNRYDNTADVPSLFHITAGGTLTNFGGAPYNVDIPGSYYGGIAVSLDGNLVAMGTTNGGASVVGTITVFELTYNEGTNVPTLTKKHVIETVNGGYTIGAALDVAGNLYAVDNNKERLRIWSLPKAENTFTTPAPATSTITVAAAPQGPQANIYASELKAEQVDGTHYKFAYTLNANALSASIDFTSGSATVNKPVSGPALLTKGAHSLTLDLGDLANGDYSWSVTATATPNDDFVKVTEDDDLSLKFGGARAFALDNSFESPAFGRIYIGVGNPSTLAVVGRTLSRGVYVFDAALSDVTGQGDVAWNAAGWVSSTNPIKAWAAPDGRVYLSDWSDAHPGAWAMSPTDPTDIVPVFGGTVGAGGATTNDGGQFIHGSYGHNILVLGEGEDTKIYSIDEDYAAGGFSFLKHDIGTAGYPYTGTPTEFSTIKCLNYGSMIPDGQGGFWVLQSRVLNQDIASVPALTHVKANGESDYNSGATADLGGSSGGAIAISPDNQLIIIGGTKTADENTKQVSLYSPVFGADGGLVSLEAPVLTIPTWDNETTGVGIDVAGNIYILGGTNSGVDKRLSIYALPSANSFTTPAPASQTIQVHKTGIITPKVAHLESRIRIASNNESVRLLTDGVQIKAYAIYNVAGVRTLNGTADTSVVEIPTHRLSAGVYLIQITTDEGTVVKRFIVK